MKTHCKRGHLRTPENVYAGGACKLCSIEYAKQTYREDPEKVKKAAKEWNKNNPRDPEKERKRLRDYHRRHPEVQRNVKLKSIGWESVDKVEEAREKQNNACAICLKEFTSTPHADHKHVVPPEPRGLLCQFCNTGLGLFLDDPRLLRLAAKYIEKHNKSIKENDSDDDSTPRSSSGS